MHRIHIFQNILTQLLHYLLYIFYQEDLEVERNIIS